MIYVYERDYYRIATSGPDLDHTDLIWEQWQAVIEGFTDYPDLLDRKIVIR